MRSAGSWPHQPLKSRQDKFTPKAIGEWKCNKNSSSDSDEEPSIFHYEWQGQWVAIYYDSTFYIDLLFFFISI